MMNKTDDEDALIKLYGEKYSQTINHIFEYLYLNKLIVGRKINKYKFVKLCLQIKVNEKANLTKLEYSRIGLKNI